MDASENKSKENFWKELFKLIILSLVIVVPFRLYVAQPFIVEGSSMDPTFKTGNYLIVDELSYRFKSPERGSVLIFKYPKDPTRHFIKRLIGLPQETVSIEQGKVRIINTEHPEGFFLDESYVKFSTEETLTHTLGKDEYFVMGDNRIASADSRIWGAVPQNLIIGRPLLRFWPLSILPGNNIYLGEVNNND